MAVKREKKEDSQHVGLRMPSKLVEKIDEIYYNNKTDRSTEIIRACEEYVERFFSKSTTVAESSNKYTAEKYKELEALQAEVKDIKNYLLKHLNLTEEDIKKEKI